jgi:metallo-beta-lactamase family protein
LEKYFEEGAVYANKKPLYTAADVEAIMPFIDVCPYGTSVNINQNFEFRLRDAGHILGSAFMKFWISTEAGRTRKIGFSGDLGQPGARIIPDNRDQMSDDYPSYGLRKGGGEFDENVDYFYNS